MFYLLFWTFVCLTIFSGGQFLLWSFRFAWRAIKLCAAIWALFQLRAIRRQGAPRGVLELRREWML